MPGLDGTGPVGLGAETGRKMGVCDKAVNSNLVRKQLPNRQEGDFVIPNCRFNAPQCPKKGRVIDAKV